MERDMDLVKEILAHLRDGNYHVEEEIERHSEEEIIYHLKIMSENDLVDVELKEVASKESGGKKEWVIGRMGGLTWRGHEFLDAAENASAWQQAKDFVQEQGSNVPFAVLQKMMMAYIKQEAGLS
jgi:hypothetical protein